MKLKVYSLKLLPSFALSVGLVSVFLSGCASRSAWLPASGPSTASTEQVSHAASPAGIQIIEVNDDVTRRLLTSHRPSLFSDVLGSAEKAAYRVGPGDVIEVSIWEAPPALLFGGGTGDVRGGSTAPRVTTFPEQMVNEDGTINIPFAGHVPTVGQSLQQIEAEVVRRLKGKANQPQVLVRTIKNHTANVTVVGEVSSSLRMPLTPRGERLLDALAAAGGVRQPINKMTLQVTRGSRVHSLPLETIIRDPRQNITLQPGDVVTSLFQPLSFIALGATGKNEEINFEATGLTLTQALARAGGLQDGRADARGAFIFRFETPDALAPHLAAGPTTPDGRIPVVYRVDLKDPAIFFVAQNFPIRDKDVLYVSNAPAAELQKFLTLIGSVMFPVIAVHNAMR